MIRATANTPVLFMDHLSYTYPESASPAISDISLEVHPGEFVLVVGPSAGGKSTLLKAACGLIPHFVGGTVAGEVHVEDQDVFAAGPGKLARSVAYLGQEPETQVVSSTVDGEIALGLELRGLSKVEVARGVEEITLALGIGELRGRSTEELSGGELQRVALAAALAMRPPLLLLDEPTSQLDPVAGDELVWLLRRLNEEWGVSVVLAEHRVERCLPAADRVVVVDRGEIAFDGSPAEYTPWALGAGENTRIAPVARLFSMTGLTPLPIGVRDARATLARVGPHRSPKAKRTETREVPPESAFTHAAVVARNLWITLGEGEGTHDALCGLDLKLYPGKVTALMGRNGAGKSTLLRAIAGLVEASYGKLSVRGSVALLGQSPGDYFVREQVSAELPGVDGEAALRKVGLSGLEERDPRDLSGGERQRLALAIALSGRNSDSAGVVALDEPTRGLDRSFESGLTEVIRDFAAAGNAVIVATHDVEFAARIADRVVLLGIGNLVADGHPNDVLSGGWYFATQVARTLGAPGVVTPSQGAEYLLAQLDPTQAQS